LHRLLASTSPNTLTTPSPVGAELRPAASGFGGARLEKHVEKQAKLPQETASEHQTHKLLGAANGLVIMSLTGEGYDS